MIEQIATSAFKRRILPNTLAVEESACCPDDVEGDDETVQNKTNPNQSVTESAEREIDRITETW